MSAWNWRSGVPAGGAHLMSLFAELKRRKVVRVAVVYAATAFVIPQAADIMLPSLGVPDWALSLIVVLVILGCPIALVLAWALELTPKGIMRTESAATEEEEAATAPERDSENSRKLLNQARARAA
jgi:hypothetical protein